MELGERSMNQKAYCKKCEIVPEEDQKECFSKLQDRLEYEKKI